MDVLQALQFSRYATRMLDAHPADAAWLERAVHAPICWTEEESPVVAARAQQDAEALAGALRVLRRRVYLHSMARDLTGSAGLSEVCSAMTQLAERAVAAATEVHHRDLALRHGQPRTADGREESLIVMGMGKLGGSELNVSSDIDLVFLFPEEGETDGGRVIGNREFFERVGRRVIASLHDVTAQGFVFRVDMRLRPYGESGPLALPLSAFEQYLVTQGRSWERYAWLKARALTGDADELQALVTPFVFRKYLDFDAYEGLRDVHRQIREQGKRSEGAANIKLGPGGIREIEFTVQALQLVRGGREPALRVPGTLPALEAVAERGLLPASAIDELREAYVFLRNLEHRLQYRDDQQTQMLPHDPAEREALARAMGFDDTPTFERELERHRDAVGGQFAAVFGETTEAHLGGSTVPGTVGDDGFDDAWNEVSGGEAARALMHESGFADASGLVDSLSRVRRGTRYLQLPSMSRDRFDKLMPKLLRAAAAERANGYLPDVVFKRLLGLLETVSRRSAYLALMIEHPPLLPRLAHLMAASAWAADYLTRHPILLDELLDARVLMAQPDWDAWRDELQRVLASHAGDAEQQMDALRHFQQAQTFRLLAQDLGGRLTVERLADHLSALADIIIAAALHEIWQQVAGAGSPPPHFAVIGYGKLGGKELGYASDLDIVLVYDDATEGALETYTRLARRLVLWLTTNTSAGQLYDIDLRLRPDGAKGLVVSSFAAFWRYQREQAWTWEHQALTRARFVAGDADLGRRFENEREGFLRLPRDGKALAEAIVAMRQRMHAGHPNRSELFDLKHDAGGMVDVEFAVQYLVLACALRYADLTRNIGNIALLALGSRLGLLTAEVAAGAAEAYRHYRRRQHTLRLTAAPHARVPPAEEVHHRQAVTALWNAVFGESSAIRTSA
ncbi:MAG: bifunctional [glutamate--ammonia ligase]-adenylyl-L-tyrosine phosphorylase/[glutamate--ammonia-ligase] adenylyltransferase [Pseudomonadota bacterium]|nr:bifunctional [glutamate--ammonia ligase]-adenylyl-L-tyrosine phosphorylase/[glutamate--ammonia-ligase] adenylyltransferase [Pseudomonadota bacterium]